MCFEKVSQSLVFFSILYYRFLKNKLKDMEAASCTDTQEETVAILKIATH